MKKYIILILLFSSCFAYSQAPTLTIRNSILGKYSGTYWDSYHQQPVVNSGCKITALSGDTTGVIISDTINGVIDTMSIGFIYDITHSVVIDTVLVDEFGNDYGDIIPAKDSISFSYITSENFPNPVGEFQLKCIQHTFPTNINEAKFERLKVYPNPTNGKIYVDCNNNLSEVEFYVYNIHGQTIKQGQILDLKKWEVDIDSFLPGIYFIKFRIENTEIVRKAIKL